MNSIAGQAQRLGNGNPASLVKGAGILTLSTGFGFVLFAVAPTAHAVLLGVVALVTLAAFLAWPELALALYVVIGDVKGDERVAALLP